MLTVQPSTASGVTALACALLTLVMAPTGSASAQGRPARAAAKLAPVRAAPASAAGTATPPRPALFYLNRGGGLLRGGKDDPAENRASIVGSSRQRADIPPFAGGDQAWTQIVACVRRGFSPFAIEVATERPAQRGYSMIMVGGPPSLARNPENVGGVAPLGDGRERQLVGLVFSDALHDEVASVCQAILHESGHILGLDHVYACEDPMSYLSCGEQRFLEIEVPCGESEPRTCKYRHTTAAAQPAALLAAATGWRGGAPPPAHNAVDHRELPVVASLLDVLPGEAAATDDEDPLEAGLGAQTAADREREARRRATAAAATLTLRALPQQPGNGLIEVVVEAHSDRHIEDAALRWANRLEVLSFACGTLAGGANPDATCSRQGNVFDFHIRAGTGQRSVRALALDARNIWLVTDAALIELRD